MTTTAPPARSVALRADSLRRTALAVGVLFVITYITSIAAKFVFYAPVLDNPDYILVGGADSTVLWGTVSELVLIIANIGTAVLLFPVLKRWHEGLALGFVAARVMESAFIAVGVLSMLTIVTLSQDYAGTAGVETGALATVGDALVVLQEWTFNLGPGFVVGVGNGIILGYLMYRSRLVPRGMAWLGLVGGPLLVLSGTAVVLGIIEAGSTWQIAATMPEFFWELSLGIYLIVKGFRPVPLTTGAADAPSA